MKVLIQFLKNYNYKNIEKTDDYLIAEGELPICLVAHLDTVSELEYGPPHCVLYDEEEGIMHAIGGKCMDDRAGVYAIMELILNGYKPHIIFTTGEETGCTGSLALVAQKPKCPWGKLKAIFQLDRCGSNDCVFYGCDNPDFVDFVKSFGFKKNIGSFSDISVIAPEWGVAAANLSVGYEYEHTPYEILYTDNLEDTISRMQDILDRSNDITMPFFKYIPDKKYNIDFLKK